MKNSVLMVNETHGIFNIKSAIILIVNTNNVQNRMTCMIHYRVIIYSNIPVQTFHIDTP